jgi:hypothetical protein
LDEIDRERGKADLEDKCDEIDISTKEKLRKVSPRKDFEKLEKSYVFLT